MKSIEHRLDNLNPTNWEQGVLDQAFSQAHGLLMAFFKQKDRELARRRSPGLTLVGFRTRRLVTRFGDVTLERRLYVDRQGQGHFLLDEALGLEKRSILSPGVKELALYLGTFLSFGKCEELLRRILPCGVSHTTLHRLVGRVVDPCLAEEDKAVNRVFEGGETAMSGQITAERLHVEADGVSIALQREDSRRAEIKVGIAYEGWETAPGRGRYRLKGKTVYLKLAEGERFWQGFSLKLGGKYDPARIGRIIINGDGASWVREGREFMGGTYQLDRFHLRRALLRGLGGDVGWANAVYGRCIQGDHAAADALLAERQQQGNADQRLEVSRLRAYLLGNIQGLADYRISLGGEALRGMGAMEGNIDKLVATRMKRRGMSWTRRGADRMAKLLELCRDGRLRSCISLQKPACGKTTARPVTALPGKRISLRAAPDTAGNLPALTGPHQNRVWVQRLNKIAHGGWNS
jgi:hypothetical protein